ncbi:hypothetical protein ACIQOV_36915 [Kitasatospora sp. NPDC091257]|uniref:hypothetical protein n=1 Tax=Kitasatospora sp. NPDC091257 TaxID=3364084 RepID=UPI0037FE45BE
MTIPSRHQPHLTDDVAHLTAGRVRDVVAVVLLVLGAIGLNTAAYATDPRLGLACTSLLAVSVAAVLGHHNEQ